MSENDDPGKSGETPKGGTENPGNRAENATPVAAKGEDSPVIPFDRARQHKEEKDAAPAPAMDTKLGDFLGPVMEGLAKELAGFADKDGVVRMGDGEEARKKAAVLVKGIGDVLSASIGQAFSKWAGNIEVGKTGGITFSAQKPVITAVTTPATEAKPAAKSPDAKPDTTDGEKPKT